MALILQVPTVQKSPPPQTYDRIHFKHPYNGCSFLTLPKVDLVHNTGSNTDARMLHTKIALSACYIIAHNKSGFFSIERQRHRAIAAKLDAEFLDVDKVYYHLYDEEIAAKYQICTTFGDWDFPRDGWESLAEWKATESELTPLNYVAARSDISAGVKMRDGKCRTTYDTGALDSCHLVPKVEGRWFMENDMDTYTTFGVDDPLNRITLRADVHKIFEDASFVYFPKNGEMRLHFLSTPGIGSCSQYQNSHFSTKGIAIQFLYARFAWAVIKNLPLDALEFSFDSAGIPMGDGDSDEGMDVGSKGDGSSDGDPKPQKKRPREKKQPHAKSKRARLRSAGPVEPREDRLRRRFPFFSDPDAIAPPCLYDSLTWHPEWREIEEQKERWMAEHPNIREVEGTEFADSSLGEDD